MNKQVNNTKLTYRSDIDGLRGIAIICVVFFHLSLKVFDGGFVGVDIFFVISGFLITRNILYEISSTGKFNFQEFYVRRFKRLFPTLILVLILTTISAILLFSPFYLKRLGGSLASAVSGISNFYFWIEADYFDTSSKFKPLLHTWALSVEEQFYLFWPIIAV